MEPGACYPNSSRSPGKLAAFEIRQNSLYRKSLNHILLRFLFFFKKMSKIFPNHLIGTHSWAILGQDNVESTLTFNPVVLRWLAHIFLCTKVLLPQRGSFPERCVVEKPLVLYQMWEVLFPAFESFRTLTLLERSRFVFWALTCCENGRVSKLNSMTAMVLRGLQF